MSLLKKRSGFLAVTALCSAAMGAAASFLSAGLGQAGNAIPTALFGGAAALFGLELALVLAALGLFLGRAGALPWALAGVAAFFACAALYGLLYLGCMLAVPQLPGLVLQALVSGAVYFAGVALAAGLRRRAFLNLPSGPLAGSAGAEASCEEPALV